MNDQQFIKIVNECKTMAFAAKKVGMAYLTFIRKAKKLGCYNPNHGGKGIKKGPYKSRIPTKEILEGKHPQFQSYKLKRRLIDEGIFEDRCSIPDCGWDKKPYGSEYSTCELDHINGDPCDHRLENLRIICPNCHSLTKSYRFRRGRTNGIEH